jgi:glutathione S-transferase
MITLYYAPRTRSVRIRWLLEELDLPYDLRRVAFSPPARTFSQRTPFGKFPVIEDGDVTIFESGAILEYILERYGDGRLAPAVGTPLRGEFLQWVHFSEGTAYPPFGTIIWHTMYKKDAAAGRGVLRRRHHAGFHAGCRTDSGCLG